MKSIGGFFELELKSDKAFYQDACALWCGRACLNLIIQRLQPTRIFIPFYTCDTLIEPIAENHVEYIFYEINEKLEIKNPPLLKEKELLIYINYFGLRGKYVEFLAENYGESLIIDNTQAFFSRPLKITSFNSARKFFGVPDGAYLSATFKFTCDFPTNSDSSSEHLIERLIGNQSAGYKKFLANEARFNSNLKKMSVLSEKILAGIDYKNTTKKRRENFAFYAETFDEINYLNLTLGEDETPFCYPLWLKKKVNKDRLHQQNIFVPTLWQDVLKRSEKGFEFEKFFAKELLPLPCDQRYNTEDCLKVIKTIQEIDYEH